MPDTRYLDLQLAMPVLDRTLNFEESLPLTGGTTALFGPSGSGKSRLLRAIAGVDWKDEGRALGRIDYAGEALLDSSADVYVPMHQRPLAYMTQAPNLFPHLSVQGNIDYAAKRALPNAPSVDHLVELLGIAALLAKRPQSLSGGEQQRVALARALARGARLLLLDEPMAALDKARKLEMMAALETIQSALDVSIILVSHGVDEVMRLANQTMVISGGKVLAHGPTLDVFDSIDQNAAVGQFEAGSLLDARVVGHDTALQLTSLDVGLDANGPALSMPLLDRLEIGAVIRLRIRARDVAIALTKPEQISIRNIVPVTFDGADASDSAAFVEAKLLMGARTLRARITKASLEELAPVQGQQIFALIKSVSFDRRMV